MTRARTAFVCQECGYRAPRWHGRCPGCGTWNTLHEERLQAAAAAGTWRPEPGASPPRPIARVDATAETRIATGLGELDRVLGGGVVPGSLVLLGGDPGIGKSTLLLQAAERVASGAGACLYVSAEESAAQLKLRAERIGAGGERLYVAAETDVRVIERYAADLAPRLLVVDSIQAVFDPELSSAPGSVAQVRECAARLLRVAKTREVAVFLVGHVTKAGGLAGPKTLEHATDAVLHFEGDRHYAYRVIRAVKNRFGSTDEVGLFEMHDRGLREVRDPSRVFLVGRPDRATGSAVMAGVEGTRPLLVEIQALLVPSPFGSPRRTATGVDPNRVAFILAVLERRMGLAVGGQDAYVKVSGGLRVVEPAADLAIALAVVSSFRDVPLADRSVVFGEVGLSGEVRSVRRVQSRVREASRLGFATCLLPEVDGQAVEAAEGAGGIEAVGVRNLSEAVEVVLR